MKGRTTTTFGSCAALSLLLWCLFILHEQRLCNLSFYCQKLCGVLSNLRILNSIARPVPVRFAVKFSVDFTPSARRAAQRPPTPDGAVAASAVGYHGNSFQIRNEVANVWFGLPLGTGRQWKFCVRQARRLYASVALSVFMSVPVSLFFGRLPCARSHAFGRSPARSFAYAVSWFFILMTGCHLRSDIHTRTHRPTHTYPCTHKSTCTHKKKCTCVQTYTLYSVYCAHQEIRVYKIQRRDIQTNRTHYCTPTEHTCTHMGAHLHTHTWVLTCMHNCIYIPFAYIDAHTHTVSHTHTHSLFDTTCVHYCTPSYTRAYMQTIASRHNNIQICAYVNLCTYKHTTLMQIQTKTSKCRYTNTNTCKYKRHKHVQLKTHSVTNRRRYTDTHTCKHTQIHKNRNTCKCTLRNTLANIHVCKGIACKHIGIHKCTSLCTTHA